MVTSRDDEFEIVLGPIRRESLWTIAALQGDLTPIHWHDRAVSELGVGERPIAQGSMIVELISRAVDQIEPLKRNIASLEVRFRRPVFVDDLLKISCNLPEGHEEWLLTVENENGVTVAEAKVEPSAFPPVS
jgi:acyl dehydratase